MNNLSKSSFLRVSMTITLMIVTTESFALNNKEIRHFSSRTSFVINNEIEQKLTNLNKKDAAEYIVNLHSGNASQDAPPWLKKVDTIRRNMKKLKRKKENSKESDVRELKNSIDEFLSYFPESKKRTQKFKNFNFKNEESKNKLFKFARKIQRKFMANALQDWWIKEMEVSKSPLTEKMVLFWHNHFVSEIKKVKDPSLMFNQNQLFRKYALGSFKELLLKVTFDPAMLIYLDGMKNIKSHPNENYARELLELFTMGEGHYKEEDIKSIAKVLTGYKYLPRKQEVRLIKRNQHKGPVTIFGITKEFKPEEVIDLILNRPETSEFIVKKIWKEFISPTPNPNAVKELATIFKNSNYNIGKLMTEVLSSKYFYDKKNIGSLIKSPVELILLAKSQFKIKMKNSYQISKALTNLGQILFNPPNVKGWPGGKRWITTATLTARNSLLSRFIDGGMRNMGMKKQNTITIFEKMSKQEIENYLLVTGPLYQHEDEEEEEKDKLMYVKKLILDPVYQLK